MLAYAVRRILMALPTLWIALTMVFVLVRVIPGDPTAAIMGDYLTKETVQLLRRQMGLDLPLWEQYLRYLSAFVQGDFGRSLVTGVPVAKQLAAALPHTLVLTAAGLLLGLVSGVPLGLLLALRRNTLIDYLGRFFSLAGLSFPSFYISVLLILVFSLELDWLPVMGAGADGDLPDQLAHLVLPALTLGLLMMSYFTRITRASFLDILGSDYVRTARAKGLPRKLVL